ncbi:DUF4239 domain-containing protein [Rhizobium grahamii]|uniref:DUF4239 domain-containing protein n=1 Tax=Rhizobium grahamii TaxID=1120045 RepID=A0A370KT41_9HYPH|nr:DUF4239 domain-containing protein [Rhizobium grahamii]RDJ13813.1 hypothetical protein B5K06_07485 [Rhizobium grahamii]
MSAVVLFGIAFVGGTIVVTLSFYFLMRLIMGADPTGKDRELAGAIVMRIASLHALILALVFAQEMIEYQQLKFESVTEANAVADIYFDANRYGADEKAAPIQQALFEYVQIVVDEEWQMLGRTGQLSPTAWNKWDNVYQRVLDLTPTNARQQSIREHMLTDVHSIAESRDKRENSGTDSISSIFWFAAVSGVVFMALGYYPYPPDARNLLLLSVLGAFTGIILFFIYAFSDPYNPPATLKPTAFERLLDELATPPASG